MTRHQWIAVIAFAALKLALAGCAMHHTPELFDGDIGPRMVPHIDIQPIRGNATEDSPIPDYFEFYRLRRLESEKENPPTIEVYPQGDLGDDGWREMPEFRWIIETEDVPRA